jgi:vacuolar iron transporter family protein
MKEELEMVKDQKTPLNTAGATFLAFFLIGLIPLLIYILCWLFDLKVENLFLYSSLATGIGLVLIGYLKSKVTEQNILKGIFETVALGGIAALLAYYVGAILERMFL